jgi:hypothetical protein
MIRFAFPAVFVLAIGCGAAESRAPSSPVTERTTERFLRRAETTSARGDHAFAAAYYEAALDAGGSEAIILPRLVVSLVRCGEIRRSLVPLSRLRALFPTNRDYESLEETIRALLGNDGSPLGGEVLR